MVKIVNRAIERMDLIPLLNKYKGGGTGVYHPLMMLNLENGPWLNAKLCFIQL